MLGETLGAVYLFVCLESHNLSDKQDARATKCLVVGGVSSGRFPQERGDKN